jgi:hypothetical protein
LNRSYNIIDADGHILEPLNLWDEHIDPEFRDRRPRFGRVYRPAQDHVGDRLSASGRLLPGAPQMIRERLGPLSGEARHQVLAGGAMGFYGLN